MVPKDIQVDGLTKEMSMTEGMRNLLKQGTCNMVPQDINKVICQNDEIKMLNIRNRKSSQKTQVQTQMSDAATIPIKKLLL